MTSTEHESLHRVSPAWFISPVTATSGYGKHKEYAVARPLFPYHSTPPHSTLTTSQSHHLQPRHTMATGGRDSSGRSEERRKCRSGQRRGRADLQRCGWNIPHKRLAQRTQPVGSKPRGQSSVAAVEPRDARVGILVVGVHIKKLNLINVNIILNIYTCSRTCYKRRTRAAVDAMHISTEGHTYV